MKTATPLRTADQFPEWPDAESRAETKTAMEELAESMLWLDTNITVHDTACPGRCGGRCLSEAEPSREDEQ